jgi:hypothetical protein
MDVATFIFGILTSLVASLFITIKQFGDSTAGYRVQMVIEATRELTANRPHTSPLRDRYRFSLGVIIDDLHQSFPPNKGFPANGPWPPLVHNGNKCEDDGKQGDRWDKFERYIRTVIEDINVYSFLGGLRLTSRIRHLYTGHWQKEEST